MKKQILFAAGAAASLLLAAPVEAASNTSNIGWTGADLGGSGRDVVGTNNTGNNSVSVGTKKPDTATEIPEPSNLLMLALGFAGLIGGRFAARRKRLSK